MDALIQSMGLANRLNFVHTDPLYVPFNSPSLFLVLMHYCRRELPLVYPSNTFEMVRLSYFSLNVAETKVSTAARAYTNIS